MSFEQGSGLLEVTLARLGSGFDLRVQTGLRDLVFALADQATGVGSDRPVAEAMIEATLAVLAVRAKGDRAFRKAVAEELGRRFGQALNGGLEAAVRELER